MLVCKHRGHPVPDPLQKITRIFFILKRTSPWGPRACSISDKTLKTSSQYVPCTWACYMLTYRVQIEALFFRVYPKWENASRNHEYDASTKFWKTTWGHWITSIVTCSNKNSKTLTLSAVGRRHTSSSELGSAISRAVASPETVND